jgi:hypothetical protein
MSAHAQRVFEDKHSDATEIFRALGLGLAANPRRRDSSIGRAAVLKSENASSTLHSSDILCSANVI